MNWWKRLRCYLEWHKEVRVGFTVMLNEITACAHCGQYFYCIGGTRVPVSAEDAQQLIFSGGQG